MEHKKNTTKNRTWTTKKHKMEHKQKIFAEANIVFLWSMLLVLTFLFLKAMCVVTPHCLWFGNMIKHASYNCKHSEFGIRIPCTGWKTEKLIFGIEELAAQFVETITSYHLENAKMSWECCCSLACSQSCSHLVQKTWKQVGWQERAYTPYESKGHSL